ncbi:phosphoadenylyl-sulfate reductase [Croceicoccus esteveae]
MNSTTARQRDIIGVETRFGPDDLAALNARFASGDAEAVLRAVLVEQVTGRAALVSSFGAESAVLLHLASRIDKDVPVLFVDTGKHFAETLAYRDRLVEHLGLTNLQILSPDSDDLARRDDSGLRWSYDPDGCCEMRKVIPLSRALGSFDASITGRKAFQSVTRTDLPVFEPDQMDMAGRLKVNPLIGWSKEDIEAWLVLHALPRHPLVDQGYPSIGCSPCTGKVTPGDDPRSGRWRGWDKVECGIHAIRTDSTNNEQDLPPGFEPVF